MKLLEIGTTIFHMKRKEFVSYIAYWEERNAVIYAYDLFSIKSYDEISVSRFEKEFLTDKEEIWNYIQSLIQAEKDINQIQVPEKAYRKLNLLKMQQECMLKQKKPMTDIKRGQRNIRRQERKIARYAEREQERKQDIDYKYAGLLEKFGWYFGE